MTSDNDCCRSIGTALLNDSIQNIETTASTAIAYAISVQRHAQKQPNMKNVMKQPTKSDSSANVMSIVWVNAFVWCRSLLDGDKCLVP